MCRQQMSAARIVGGSPSHGHQPTEAGEPIQLAPEWRLTASACEGFCAEPGPICTELGHGPVQRLLVTWRPASAVVSEGDLKLLFQQYGTIQELQLLQDSHTGHSLGCAVLTYTTSQAAADALSQLRQGLSQQQLPQQLQDLKVQYAQQPTLQPVQLALSSSDYACCIGAISQPAGAEPLQLQQKQQQQQQQLMLPSMSSDSVGPASVVSLQRGRIALQSSNVGSSGRVVTRPADSQQSAGQMLQQLQLQQQQQQQLQLQQQQQPHQPLPELPEQQQPEQQQQAQVDVEQQQPPQQQQEQQLAGQQAEQPAQRHHTLFFAKVPRSASRSAILELFSAFGEVVDFNLFAESADAPVSKGCGLVMFADLDVALRVLQQLGGKYTWKGMRSPMVLKLMNPDSQHKKQQQQQLQTPAAAAAGSSSSSGPRSASRYPSSHMQHGHYYHPAAAGAGGYAPVFQDVSGAVAWQLQQQQQYEQMPSECSSDAYKLFVGNIPKSYSAAALRPVLESIGPIAEVVIIRDKLTAESKGSAFVWYCTGAHADQAVQQFNMRIVLPGLHPDEALHSRPLVVKRAMQQWRSNSPAAAAAAGPSSSSSSSRGYNVPAYMGAVHAEVPAAAAAINLPQLLQQPAPLAASPVAAAGMPAGQILAAPAQQQLLQQPQITQLTPVPQQQQQQQQQQYLAQLLQQQQQQEQQQQQRQQQRVQVPAHLQQLVFQQQQPAMPQYSTVHHMLLQHQQQQQLQQSVSAPVALADQFAMMQLQPQQQVQSLGSSQHMQLVQLTPQLAAAAVAGSPAFALGHNLLPTAAGSSPGLPGTGIQGLAVQDYSPSGGQEYQTAFMQGNPALVQGYSQAGQAALGAVQGYGLPGVQGNLQGPVQGYVGLPGVQGNSPVYLQAPQAAASGYMSGLPPTTETQLPGFQF